MSEAVYIATTRNVAPELKDSFIAALKGFIERSRSAPGVLDAYIISDGVTGQDVGILRSFSSAEAKKTFYQSELFLDWQKEAEDRFGALQAYQHQLHGLEAFFRHSHRPGSHDELATGAPPQPPAIWKMAIITYCGVTPTVAIWMFGFQPAFGFSAIVSLFLSNVFIVAMLTWVVMPLLTTLFKSWLERPVAAISAGDNPAVVPEENPQSFSQSWFGHWRTMTIPADALLRILTGLALATIHGWHKIVEGFAYLGGAEWRLANDVSSMGLPFPGLGAWAAALSQFVGGLCLLIGFMTRPAALFAAGSLAVAVIANLSQGKGAELATAYLVILIVIALKGPDKLSLDDRLFSSSKDEENRD